MKEGMFNPQLQAGVAERKVFKSSLDCSDICYSVGEEGGSQKGWLQGAESWGKSREEGAAIP